MLRALALCVLLVGLLPAAAAAEWHFTPMVGFTFKGATNINDIEFGTESPDGATRTHKNFGGAVSLLGEGILGVEAIGVWTPALFQSDDSPIQGVDTGRAVAFMGNAVLTTPRLWTEFSLRPYFSGGVGLMAATVTQTETATGAIFDPVRLTAPGYDLGIGAIGFLTERTGVRFDFRYYSTFRRSSADLFTTDPDVAYLRYFTASIGIVWRRR